MPATPFPEQHQDRIDGLLAVVWAAIADGAVCPVERRRIEAAAAPVVAGAEVIDGGLRLIRMFANTLAPTPQVMRRVREMERDVAPLLVVAFGGGDDPDGPAALEAA